jgi:hypothetical protein
MGLAEAISQVLWRLAPPKKFNGAFPKVLCPLARMLLKATE